MRGLQRPLRVLAGLTGAAALLAFAACDPNINVATPNAFDRPESIAFFCWSFEADAPVALEECAPRAIAAGENDLAEPRDNFALHALVTQTGTGEVAAVRLSGDSAEGEPGVIDSDVRVPGFTFVAVGDVPSGLALSRLDPKHVFVVSRGSAEVAVIEVAAFRKGLGVAVETLRPAGISAGARPSAVLLTPDETALLIALPIAGQIARVPILGDGQLGDAELLDLSAPEPEPVDLSLVPPAELAPDYLYTCGIEPPPVQPTPIAPRAPRSLGETPQPWSFLVDPETGEIFVSDRNRPVIHRIDPTTFTELPPIAVSVPTRGLALSPRVPAALGGLAPSERFLYAIDEIDRTVLAVDLSDPARSTYGGVLPVSVTAPEDRFDAPLPARGLAVVSPTYDPAALSFCTDAQQGELASSVSLHGVFLTVATVDGRIRFFDVYDLDTPCRGSTSCAMTGTNPDPADTIVAIGRHRPRLTGRITEPVQVDPAPAWSLRGSATESVDDDGLADGAPSLVAVDCPAGLSQVFPTTAAQAPLICAVRDPWTAINQSFTASYEGRLPSAGTTGANIDATEPFFEVRFDPCAAGVIGSLDVPETGELSEYAGDVVAITADLPPSILEGDDLVLDRCEELTERTVAGSTTPVILPLLRAATRPEGLRDSYTGRLEVGDPISPAGFTLDDVRTCFPELLQIEVRVAGVFAVTSTRAGFRHPIVRAEDDGRCVVDPALAAAGQRGRVACGATFRSPEVAFAIGACPADPSSSVLEFTVGDVPVPLTIDVSSIGGTDRESLLESLVYNPIDERLYAIDQSVAGLIRIRLSDLNIQQTFR